MVRKIRAKMILKLNAEGLSARQIEAHGMSRHSVAVTTQAAAREGLTWEAAADMSENAVYVRLFPGRGDHESVYAQPDWAKAHKELAKVGVTLKLLHAEYLDRCRAASDTAMGYDRFCKNYAQYARAAGVTSRVGHKCVLSSYCRPFQR
jgi:transposase